jgi:hypothetical protein
MELMVNSQKRILGTFGDDFENELNYRYRRLDRPFFLHQLSPALAGDFEI